MLSVSPSVTVRFTELRLKLVRIKLSHLCAASIQINGASSLFMLGSLVVGVPATTFSSINGSQLLTASKNPSFLGYMTSAPLIVRQIFITQVWQLHFCYRNLFISSKSQIGPRKCYICTTYVICTYKSVFWKVKDCSCLQDATTRMPDTNCYATFKAKTLMFACCKTQMNTIHTQKSFPDLTTPENSFLQTYSGLTSHLTLLQWCRSVVNWPPTSPPRSYQLTATVRRSYRTSQMNWPLRSLALCCWASQIAPALSLHSTRRSGNGSR